MARFALLMAALLAIGVTADTAPDPVAKCSALKIKATGKKTFDKAKCHQKAVVKGEAVDLECLTKAETKFTAAIAKADAAGTCTGDAGSLEAAVDACVETYLAAVGPPTTCGTAPSDYPTCGGSCPPGEDCVPQRENAPVPSLPFCDCFASTEPCGQGPIPMCRGWCAPGSTCVIVAGAGMCECQPT